VTIQNIFPLGKKIGKKEKILPLLERGKNQLKENNFKNSRL